MSKRTLIWIFGYAFFFVSFAFAVWVGEAAFNVNPEVSIRTTLIGFVGYLFASDLRRDLNG